MINNMCGGFTTYKLDKFKNLTAEEMKKVVNDETIQLIRDGKIFVTDIGIFPAFKKFSKEEIAKNEEIYNQIQRESKD